MELSLRITNGLWKVLMVSDTLWNGINIIKNTVANAKVIFIERSVDILQNYQNHLGSNLQSKIYILLIDQLEKTLDLIHKRILPFVMRRNK